VRCEFALHLDEKCPLFSVKECKLLLNEAEEVYRKLEMDSHLGFCLALKAKALLEMGKEHLFDAKD